MTMPAYAQELGSRLPSANERAVANNLRQILAAHAQGGTTLRLQQSVDQPPTEVTLTPGLSALLIELLRHLGQGDAVTLVPISQQLTTQQAADILNVSRPFLINILERGDLPFERVGRHRRIKAEDLFEYKRSRDGRRSQALDALAAIDAELL
ncbi:MAG: helix-turn-helix domain-containing protein [Hyphomonadaceae bacterium]